MSKKKNSAMALAGAAAMALGTAIIVTAVLAVTGVIKIDRPANSDDAEALSSESQSVTVEEEKNKDLEWQAADAAPEDLTATVETEAGALVLKLYPGAAAEKFAELAESGGFADAPFATVAENMFVQCPALSEETFGAEQNELACVYGAAGFAADSGEISDSLFIVTANGLSGMSSAYIFEHSFAAERAALYASRGGMPEYEGRVFIFGQVVSGFDVLDAIAAGATNGYTGGYAAENPVKILSVTISRTAEESSSTENAE